MISNFWIICNVIYFAWNVTRRWCYPLVTGNNNSERTDADGRREPCIDRSCAAWSSAVVFMER